MQVGSWAAPLGSAVEFLLRPGARQQNDASTARELDTSHLKQELPPGLSVRWLGTAGFVFTYENYALVIDPYITRAGMRPVIGNQVLHSNAEQLAKHVPQANAILVGHTHFDHALDVPVLAKQHGCQVYGSRSLQTLMALHDADLAVQVDPGHVYALGPFEVTFVPSQHSKLVLGMKVNAEGEITCDHLDRMHQGHYRCGQVWAIHIKVAGRTFYHQGSANLIEDALLHRNVDYLLCGIAGRGYTTNFTQRILRALSPRTVIVHHHDNFFLPLDQPMGFSFNVNLGGFVEEVRHVSNDFEVVVPTLLGDLKRFAPQP